MPEVDEQVMKFVEKTLTQHPDMQLEELFQRAKEFKSSMSKLSKRQFNARYPLQVKRRRALAARRTSGKGKEGAPSPRQRSRKAVPIPGAPRDRVRQVLLQFATDIAAAEEKKDLVRVLAGVDDYVNQVMQGMDAG